MEFSMGSNTIRNTNGVIKAEGKDQVLLEIGTDLQVLLTMDIYDAKGTHVAKVIRNTFAFDYKDRFRLTLKPRTVLLVNRELGTVLIEAALLDKDKVQVIQGSFYSCKGHLVEITPRCWRVMGDTISGTIFDSHGGAVVIGS